MRHPELSKDELRISVPLDSGFTAPLPFYLLIQENVCQVMPFLEDYTIYFSEDLLEFWSKLNSAETRMAELVIAEQIRRGEYALRAATLGANGPTVFVKMGE